VLRVGKDGKPFTLFETKDLSVQVVRLGPGWRALRGHAAQRQGLPAEGRCDHQAGRIHRHVVFDMPPSWTMEKPPSKPEKRPPTKESGRRQSPMGNPITSGT
jgi:hypothetical protein